MSFKPEPTPSRLEEKLLNRRWASSSPRSKSSRLMRMVATRSKRLTAVHLLHFFPYVFNHFICCARILRRRGLVLVHPAEGHRFSMTALCEACSRNRCIFRDGLQRIGHIYLERPAVNVPLDYCRENCQDRPYSEAGDSAEGAEGLLWACCADDLKKERNSSS